MSTDASKLVDELAALASGKIDAAAIAELTAKLSSLKTAVETSDKITAQARKTAKEAKKSVAEKEATLKFMTQKIKFEAANREPTKVVRNLRELMDPFEMGTDPLEFLVSFDSAVRAVGLDETFMVQYFHKILESSTDDDVTSWSKVNHSSYVKELRDKPANSKMIWKQYQKDFSTFFDPEAMIAKAENDLRQFQFTSDMSARTFFTKIKKLSLAVNSDESSERIIRAAVRKLPDEIAIKFSPRDFRSENDFIGQLEHQIRYWRPQQPCDSASRPSSSLAVRTARQTSTVYCHYCNGPNHIQRYCAAYRHDHPYDTRQASSAMPSYNAVPPPPGLYDSEAQDSAPCDDYDYTQ